MPDINTNIDKFIATILDDATDESRQVMARVKKHHDTAISRAEDQFLAESYRQIKNEVAKIRVEASQRYSKRALEGKKEIYELRKSISDDVFAAFQKRVEEYVKTDAYGNKLVELARKASAVVKNAAVTVYVAERDLPFASVLTGEFANATCEASPKLTLGGLVVERKDGTVRIDTSFDASFADLRERFNEIFNLGI